MLSFAAPYVLLLLPLPWLIWRFLPPYRDRVRAIRIPFFRRVTDAARVEPQEGAVILTRTRIQMLAAILVWVLTVLALAVAGATLRRRK